MTWVDATLTDARVGAVQTTFSVGGCDANTKEEFMEIQAPVPGVVQITNQKALALALLESAISAAR